MPEDARIDGARAEGTSHRSANPSAVSFSVDLDVSEVEARGFDCSSDEARYVIERIGMHRLSFYLPLAYWNSRNDRPSLTEAHDLMTYDRRVQSIVLKYVGVFETQLRARYAREMSAEHGEMSLYDPGMFRDEGRYRSAMKDVERELSRQSRRCREIRECVESGRKVPISTAVEYMSLGTLSKLFSNTNDTGIVARIAGVFNVSTSKARGWFRTVADVRNACAHFNPYIVRKQIPTTPMRIVGCEMSNRSPFYIFPMLHTMLSSEQAARFDDRNLDYAQRMVEDMTAHTIGFARCYMATAQAIDVPTMFLDPSSGSWKGARQEDYEDFRR